VAGRIESTLTPLSVAVTLFNRQNRVLISIERFSIVGQRLDRAI
jgi:hypothetical protein